MNGAPPMDQVLDDMLSSLREHLPDASPPLPSPGLSVVSLAERPLAIGNRRGIDRRGSFSIVELKGGRLEAVIRFLVWGGDPAVADAEIDSLRGRLLAAGEALRTAGFLKIAAEGITTPERIDDLNAWNKTADYRVLYEFNYPDVDGAESIIVRIPIDGDGEITTVTDEIVRWDDQGTPTLEVHGGAGKVRRIDALTILAFLPAGEDGESVAISSSIGGIDQIQSFPTLRVFRDAFDLEMEGNVFKTVDLGGRSYFAGRMDFPNPSFPEPLVMEDPDDSFEVQYLPASADDNKLGEDAVVYLRLLSSG
jgi:hypothetical protein